MNEQLEKSGLSALSKNEEDYLKELWHLTHDINEELAGTNRLASSMGVSPASVNGMIKKLKGKGLVESEKYGKLRLSTEGKSIATMLIRKHRLWETFLYKHMNFTWDEVHEVAEQLEHIKSPKLIHQLDAFLGHPKFDPHGDSIPDEKGTMIHQLKKSLSEVEPGSSCTVVSVKDASVAFLQLVSQMGIGLNSQIKVLGFQEFDGMIEIEIDGQQKKVSQKFANNVFVLL